MKNQKQQSLQRITKQELITKLRGLLTATFATIITVTEPKMRKTNNPYYGRVKKIGIANVTINFNYANSVNRQLAKAGESADFVPHERAWGKRIEGTPLVEHTNKKGEHKMYLECRFSNAGKTTYLLDDAEVQGDLPFAEFLSEKHSNAEHQGLDPEKEVILRDYDLANVREIKMLGEHYLIIQ